MRNIDLSSYTDDLEKKWDPSARETVSHCAVTLCGIRTQSVIAQDMRGLGENGWSARLTGCEQWNQKGMVGVYRKEADYFKYVCRVNGRDHLQAGGRTHPGANAGRMHARVVMRRMLKFMRNGVAGRQGQ
ncbi:MAG: hypothetical protein M3M98_01370 [Nitrospirota bacterium]|nr:hypothetical protein [Nitrospirota bacterium]